VSWKDKKKNLKRLRFENGDVIPDVESYFGFYKGVIKM
jgi:hypothetical protein